MNWRVFKRWLPCLSGWLSFWYEGKTGAASWQSSDPLKPSLPRALRWGGALPTLGSKPGAGCRSCPNSCRMLFNWHDRGYDVYTRLSAVARRDSASDSSPSQTIDADAVLRCCCCRRHIQVSILELPRFSGGWVLASTQWLKELNDQLRFVFGRGQVPTAEPD